jgi:ADP-ribose pyrophosphatase YjhB (NUDIX family)
MGTAWGWGDIGLSPNEVVVKEIKEESGFEAEPIRLLGVMDKKFHEHPPSPFHVYKFFIQCRIIGGQAAGGVETTEVGFFAEDALPELSAERNTPSQIHKMFEYLRDPGKEMFCD